MKFGFLLLAVVGLSACGTAHKRSDDVQVFYEVPKVKYKKVCHITESGDNFVSQQYTKKSDFASKFRRRARNCGANAVIITDMFAFERGSAFADGIAVYVPPVVGSGAAGPGGR
ncbi:MAG: hypothetical protein AB7F86_17590 [Bdellovibrionales bacterium]